MSVFDIFKKLEEEKTAKAAQPIEWLVVGLGNPGSKYDNTRHNAGFRALESYCARSGQKIDRMKFKALAGEGMLGGKRVLFLKPRAADEAADVHEPVRRGGARRGIVLQDTARARDRAVGRCVA